MRDAPEVAREVVVDDLDAMNVQVFRFGGFYYEIGARHTATIRTSRNDACLSPLTAARRGPRNGSLTRRAGVPSRGNHYVGLP
jgi:hypothetical protein